MHPRKIKNLTIMNIFPPNLENLYSGQLSILAIFLYSKAQLEYTDEAIFKKTHKIFIHILQCSLKVKEIWTSKKLL